ncbi:hypothetical protein MKX08_000602 [Trichoderma sp. CBMAI-0020]|nr:hypothetical protein MKX08_000602 [Trichoderma sp. CBMAI-0020]
MAQLRPRVSRANQDTAPRPWPAARNDSKGSGRTTAYCSPVRSRLSLAVREAAGDVASVAALRDRCPAWSHTWIRFAQPRPDSTRIQGLAWRPGWRDLGTPSAIVNQGHEMKQEDAWVGSVQICSALPLLRPGKAESGIWRQCATPLAPTAVTV